MEAPPVAADETTAELDDLRRRLYRPGAGPEDVRRYATARGATAIAPPASPPPQAVPRQAGPRDVEVGSAPPVPRPAAARPPSAGRRRGRLVVAAIVLAVAAGAAAAGLLAPAPTDVVTVRTSFVEQEPTGPARAAPGFRDTAAQAFHGRGSATARLDTAGMPGRGGRLDLLLVLARTARARWIVEQVHVGPDQGSSVRVVSERGTTRAEGVPQWSSLPYPAQPPSVVSVRLPADVPWILVVRAIR